MSDSGFLFTSESVTEGHPDKIADQISDAVLDAALAEDAYSRVACETLLTTGLIVVAGEITTAATIDYAAVARKVVNEIGYDNGEYYFDGNAVGVVVAMDRQSPDIAQGVDTAHEGRVTGSEDPFDKIGAGDQGMMFGYATNETPEYMPTPIILAHKLSKKLSEVRHSGLLPYLRPDGKTQVTVRYDDAGKPVEIEKVLISTQHQDGVESKLPEALWEEVVLQTLPADLYDPNRLKDEFYVNPTGRFVIGGPVGDTGLTGRKIIVDTYGGVARHGGGGLSRPEPAQGGPVRQLRGAAGGQEHRGRRARRPGRSPGGLRDRDRPAAVPADRDLRHREDRPGRDRRPGPRPLRPAAGRPGGGAEPAQAHLQANRRLRPLRPRRIGLHLGEHRQGRRPPHGGGSRLRSAAPAGPSPSCTTPGPGWFLSVCPRPGPFGILVAGTPNTAGLFGRGVIVRRDRPWESPH